MADLKGTGKGVTQKQPISRTMEYYQQVQGGSNFGPTGHPAKTGQQSKNLGSMGSGGDPTKVARKNKYVAVTTKVNKGRVGTGTGKVSANKGKFHKIKAPKGSKA